MRFFLLTLGTLLIASQHGSAKPLSSEECTKLVSEHADLVKKDIESLMEQDPDVAIKQMKSEQLIEIERFLFIEGEIRFRCPEIQLAVPELPEQETQPGEAKTADQNRQEPEQPSGPPVPLPNRKPAPPAKRAG